jgi:hypothetical protein
MAEPTTTRNSLFREIGGTGLNIQGGMLQEEYRPELRGLQGVKTYNEMAETPICGAIEFIIEQMVAQVKWEVKPFSEEAKDQEAKEFVEECLHDMSFSLADTLSEVCTFFRHGWSFLETVMKVRRGYQPFDSALSTSKYDDGKIGWRKWALRGQNTLSKWDIDDSGGIRGMVQEFLEPISNGQTKVTIPIQKAMLFRTRVVQNSPEGVSIFRKAYRPWWLAKRLEESESISHERDGSGLPVLTTPEGFNWDPADTIASAALRTAEKLVTGIRRGEKEGVLLPFGWELALLSSSSRRSADLGATITRHETRICQSTLTQFLMLGTGRTGSWALSSDQTDMFVLALAGYLKQIKEVINRHGIPRLLEIKQNGFDPSRPPYVDHGDIETQNLAELGSYISALSTAGGIMFPDESLERHLRLVAGLPPPPEPEEREEQMMIQEEIRQRVEPEEPELEAGRALVREGLEKMAQVREMMLAKRKAEANGHNGV